MTEVLNLFTPEEQQEVIDILSNNGLEKSTNKWKKLITISIRTIARSNPHCSYLQRLWDMQTCKDYPFDEFKKIARQYRCRIRKRFAQLYPASIYPLSRRPLENAKEDRPFKLWYIYWAMEHYRMESSLNISSWK